MLSPPVFPAAAEAKLDVNGEGIIADNKVEISSNVVEEELSRHGIGDLICMPPATSRGNEGNSSSL